MKNKLRFIHEHNHTILMLFWMCMVPVTLFTSLKTSVTFVVLMSLYANIEASASAREAKKG